MGAHIKALRHFLSAQRIIRWAHGPIDKTLFLKTLNASAYDMEPLIDNFNLSATANAP